MRLNIGCGNVPLRGYINVDKYYYPESTVPLTDKSEVARWYRDYTISDINESKWIYGDAVHLDFPDDTFDEVLMIHVLEHLSMEDGNLAIKEAHRVCKPGGTVDIELPDLTVACENFLKVHVTPEGDNRPWHRVMGCIYGTTGMDGEGQFHLCGYSKEYLRFKMEERGFHNVIECPVGFGHGNSSPTGFPEPQYDFRMRGTK
jgi:predicted SAM-dependent methyltransferase